MHTYVVSPFIKVFGWLAASDSLGSQIDVAGEREGNVFPPCEVVSPMEGPDLYHTHAQTIPPPDTLSGDRARLLCVWSIKHVGMLWKCCEFSNCQNFTCYANHCILY